MSVLVEDAAEAIAASYVEAGDLLRIGDRWRQRVQRAGVGNALVRPVSVVTVKVAPQSPRMNAHCERGIGTLRREALDLLLLWSERHALRVLSTYAGHCNGHRPHQARGRLLPLADHHTARLTDLKTPRRLFQTRVLGGLINEYRYAA
ncbi:integrase core domain-containing protein [Streptomyces violaceusniger]|uniref:Integrase catalytic domain-containing protein n=1 Tax=Streptomyces violaceusniger TaxID=68280 RepID=A0A4D4KU25_STRVO|nr:hypothetical protein SVIO_028250 [Streptomyces violaceusniger]